MLEAQVPLNVWRCNAKPEAMSRAANGETPLIPRYSEALEHTYKDNWTNRDLT